MNSRSISGWRGRLLSVCAGLSLCGLATAPARASVKARIVRLEAPSSFIIQLYEVEVYSGDRNIALHNRDIKFAGVGYRRDINERHEGPSLIDGKVDRTRRGIQMVNPGANDPWVELDLGADYDIDRVVIAQPTDRLYNDRYLRTLTLMDAQRRVVWSDTRNIGIGNGWRKPTLTWRPGVTPGRLVGRTVPSNTATWLPMSEYFDLPPTPPIEHAAEQSAAFEHRNDPAETRRLADVFFARLDPAAPGLSEAFGLYRAGKAQEALDAFKRHFFRDKLAPYFALNHAIAQEFKLDGEYTWGTDRYGNDYPRQAQDLMNGYAVTFDQHAIHAIRFQPGTINWTYIPKGASERSVTLDIIRDWAMADVFTHPLLETYIKGGDPAYLDRWAAITDDWSMHFFKQADASRANLRFLFVMTPLGRVLDTLERLHTAAQKQKGFVDRLPSQTLARFLMVSLEEYGPSYWRVCRKLVFNHTFNALTEASRVSPMLDDFWAGQRLEDEARHQWVRNWTYGITRDGSMIEVGDEGHMAVPMNTGSPLFEMLRKPPAWLTPSFVSWWEDQYRLHTIYQLRHIGPDGYYWRMDNHDAFPRVMDLTQRVRTFQGSIPAPQFMAPGVLDNHDFRAIIDTVYGRGHPDNPDKRREPQHKQVADWIAGPYTGPPRTISDWMPYAGLWYLRGGWSPDDSFLQMICQQATNPSSGGQLWDTQVLYNDFGYPLLTANPITIDGQQQYPCYNQLRFFPGSKTERITEAPEKPMETRWLTTPNFDFAEAVYNGAYQNRHYDYQHELLSIDGKAVPDVHTTRQVIQARAARLFIVTDRVHIPDAATHQFGVNYTLKLSHKSKPNHKTMLDESRIHAAANHLSMDGDRTPSVHVWQFGASAVSNTEPTAHRDPPRRTDPRSRHLDTGFAQRTVLARWTGGADTLLVSLFAADPAGGPARVTAAQPLRGGDAVGFTATLADGTRVSYLAANHAPSPLVIGAVKATAEAMLVEVHAGETRGILLGATGLIHGADTIGLPAPDIEFRLDGGKLADVAVIRKPIDPVNIGPAVDVFTDSAPLVLTSKTPGVEIHYTLDGSEPLATSPLYTGPVQLTGDTFVKARAFRKGVTQVPFTTAGTDVSAISYAWFRKQPLKPATNIAVTQPGLHYDYVEGNWFKLFTDLTRLPATSSGTTDHLLDVSPRNTDGPFGMRYVGYLDAPADGVYTFYGPPEFVRNIAAPGYDLRLFIDGQEWDLGQHWHALGTWSVPLAKGPHRFAVTFADARAKDIDHQPFDLWRDYPHPWVVWRGKAPVIEISGPGITKQPIPDAWLRQP